MLLVQKDISTLVQCSQGCLREEVYRNSITKVNAVRAVGLS